MNTNTTSSIFFSLYRKSRLYHTPAILLLLALIPPCALGGSGSGKPHPPQPHSDTSIVTNKYKPQYMDMDMDMANIPALYRNKKNQSNFTKEMKKKISKKVQTRMQQQYALIITDELEKEGCEFNKETGQIVKKIKKGTGQQEKRPSLKLSPTAPWFAKNQNQNQNPNHCSSSTQHGASLTAPAVGLDSSHNLCFFAAGTVALCAALGKEGIDQLTHRLLSEERRTLFNPPRHESSLVHSLDELKEAFFCHNENKTNNDRQQQADNAAKNIREQIRIHQENHTYVKESNFLFSENIKSQRQQDPAEYLNLLLELIGGRGSSFQFNETDIRDSSVPYFLELFSHGGEQSRDRSTLKFTENETTTKKMLIVNVEPGERLQVSINAYLECEVNESKKQFTPSDVTEKLKKRNNISFKHGETNDIIHNLFTADGIFQAPHQTYQVTTIHSRKLSACLTPNEETPSIQFKTLIVQHGLAIENTGNYSKYGVRKMNTDELRCNNSVSDNMLLITFCDTVTNDKYRVTFTRTAICAHAGSNMDFGHYVALVKDTNDKNSNLPPSFIKYDGHTTSDSLSLATHMENGIGDICISFYTVESIEKIN